MKLRNIEFETELRRGKGLIVIFKEPITEIHYTDLELIYNYCDLGCPKTKEEFYKILNEE